MMTRWPSREHGRDVDERMDVIRPAVQQDHGGAVCGPQVDIADVEDARLDLLQRAERGRSLMHTIRCNEFSSRDDYRRGSQQATALASRLSYCTLLSI